VVGQVTEILDKQRENMTQTPKKRNRFYNQNEALSLSETTEAKKMIHHIWCDQTDSALAIRCH
jgi:hypothetical protein